MQLRRASFLLGLALVLASCEVPFDTELTTAASQVVVEGLVTTGSGPHLVIVSRSIGFSEGGKPPAVTTALVRITDDLGNSDFLTQTEPGFYETDSLVGAVGRRYFLSVLVDGQTYTATDTLRLAPDIDSVRYRFIEETSTFDEGYYLRVFFQELPQEEDFLRFRYLRNGLEFNPEPENIFVVRDKNVNGNYLSFEAGPPFTYELADTFTFVLESITEPVFDYFDDVSQLAAGAGSPFAAPPFTPRTNITGGALGVFRTSQVRSLSGIIE